AAGLVVDVDPAREGLGELRVRDPLPVVPEPALRVDPDRALAREWKRRLRLHIINMVRIPAGKSALVAVEGREVQLTNLDKPFWPELGLTKRGLIQYYADVAPPLLPHIRDRPMVLERYPDRPV